MRPAIRIFSCPFSCSAEKDPAKISVNEISITVKEIIAYPVKMEIVYQLMVMLNGWQFMLEMLNHASASVTVECFIVWNLFADLKLIYLVVKKMICMRRIKMANDLLLMKEISIIIITIMLILLMIQMQLAVQQ
jgi:hypothetical protein